MMVSNQIKILQNKFYCFLKSSCHEIMINVFFLHFSPIFIHLKVCSKPKHTWETLPYHFKDKEFWCSMSWKALVHVLRKIPFPISLYMIKQSWIKRKQLLEHDFVVTSWAYKMMWNWTLRIIEWLSKESLLSFMLLLIQTPMLPMTRLMWSLTLFENNLIIFKTKLESLVCTLADYFSQMRWMVIHICGMEAVDMLSTYRKVGHMSENFETNVAVYNTSYRRFLVCGAYQIETN